MKCQSCRNEDPTTTRRYYRKAYCDTCDTAYRMVHTSVSDAICEVRNCTSLRALRKALFLEGMRGSRKGLVAAIERRIRKLRRAAERSEGSPG